MADPGNRSGQVFARWVTGVTKRALLVIALCLLSGAGALYYTLSHMGINTSVVDMLSADLPFRQNDIAVMEAFPAITDSLVVVVEGPDGARNEKAAERLSQALAQDPALFPTVFYPQADPFFRRNGLLYQDTAELEALSNRLAQAQPLLISLQDDPTLRGLAALLGQAMNPALQEQGEVEAQAGLEGLAPSLRAMAEAVENLAQDPNAQLQWRDLIRGEVAKGDRGGTRQLIAVKPALDYASLAPAAPALRAIEQQIADLGLADDPSLSIRVTGEPLLLQDELASVEQGIGWVGLISFVLVSLLLAIGLRSGSLILATLITLIVGLIWTAFAAAVVVGELNLISVAFAVLFIGLSVDFGIHFCLRYQEAMGAGPQGDKAEALRLTARHIGGALTLTAVTAAIGFLSFLPTSYRGLSELGLISAMGMGIALFSNLTLLPALLSCLSAPQGVQRRPLPIAGRLDALITRHRRSVLVGAGLLALACLASLPFARFDDDPMNLRDPDSPSVAVLFDLLDDPRVQPYAAEILVPDRESAARIAAQLNTLPEVASTIWLGDYLPNDQDEKLAIIEEMGFFLSSLLFPSTAAAPPDAQESTEALASLDRSLAAAEDGPLAEAAGRLRQALADARAAGASPQAIEAALLSDLPDQLDRLAEALLAEDVDFGALPDSLIQRSEARDGRNLIQVNPAWDLRDQAARHAFVAAIRSVAPNASGPPVVITEAGRAVVVAFTQALTIAVIAISLLLLVVLRSIKDSLFVLAPLSLAALMTVAATVVLNLPFNFANIIVLPLLFGLGVAGGIHLVMRTRSSDQAAMLQSSTPRAVFFSSLTTIGSFCALALSSHRGTASMGELLTIAITFTLLSCLVVLPALLADTKARG